MTGKASAAVVSLIVLMGISLSLAGGVFYFYQQERTKAITLTSELETVKEERQAVEQKLRESEKKASKFELDLQESQKEVYTLTSTLKTESTAKQEALAKAESLAAELDRQKTMYAELERRLGQAQTETEKAQLQAKDLGVKKTELESRLQNLEAKASELEEALGHVQLGNIVVTSPGSSPRPEPMPQALSKQAGKAAVAEKEGTVLVVNKEYNFIVVNLGSKDGIGIGDVFSVYHNNKYVGDVKVEQIHDTMAAAGFVSADLKGKVFESDKIVQKLK